MNVGIIKYEIEESGRRCGMAVFGAAITMGVLFQREEVDLETYKFIPVSGESGFARLAIPAKEIKMNVRGVPPVVARDIEIEYVDFILNKFTICHDRAGVNFALRIAINHEHRIVAYSNMPSEKGSHLSPVHYAWAVRASALSAVYKVVAAPNPWMAYELCVNDMLERDPKKAWDDPRCWDVYRMPELDGNAHPYKKATIIGKTAVGFEPMGSEGRTRRFPEGFEDDPWLSLSAVLANFGDDHQKPPTWGTLVDHNRTLFVNNSDDAYVEGEIERPYIPSILVDFKPETQIPKGFDIENALASPMADVDRLVLEKWWFLEVGKDEEEE